MLDIASGFGIDSFLFRLEGFGVTGLEPDKVVGDIAERYLGISSVNCVFEEFELSRKYDVVYLNQVIEHVHDINFWLSKLKKHIKQGGLLVMRFPNLNSFWHKTIKMKDPYFKPPLHLNHFSKKAILLALRKHGYDISEVSFNTYIPPAAVLKKLKLPTILEKPAEWVMEVGQRPFCKLMDRFGKGIFMEVMAKPRN